MSLPDQAFAAIVSRPEDAEDGIERRVLLAGCTLVLSGSMLALVAVVNGWPLWAAIAGFAAAAGADVIGARTVIRQIRRRPSLTGQQRWFSTQEVPY